MTPHPQQQPKHRIAVIQEKDYLEDTYKTRTVIGLLPYEKGECDRLMRFMPEQYSRPAPTLTPAAPSHSECYKKGYADAVANALSQHIDCVKCLEEDRVTMIEHDATVRNQTIKQMMDIICDYSDGDMLSASFVRSKINSLRTQSTQEQP